LQASLGKGAQNTPFSAKATGKKENEVWQYFLHHYHAVTKGHEDKENQVFQYFLHHSHAVTKKAN